MHESESLFTGTFRDLHGQLVISDFEAGLATRGAANRPNGQRQGEEKGLFQ